MKIFLRFPLITVFVFFCFQVFSQEVPTATLKSLFPTNDWLDLNEVVATESALESLSIVEKVTVPANAVLAVDSVTTTVWMKGNSTLELLPGAVLILFWKQRLHIDYQGELILHPGSQIILWHPQAELRISGKVTLLPDAVFHPIGPGRLLFSQRPSFPHPTGSFWQVDPTNAIVFSDTIGQTSVIFSQSISFPNAFQKIAFHNVDVLFHQDVEIVAAVAELYLFQSTFAAAVTNQKWDGLKVTFQQTFFDGNSFFNAKKALSLVSLSGGSVLFENAQFHDCDTGLVTKAFPVELEAAAFSTCIFGWLGLDLSGHSAINHCDFFNNTFGAVCRTQANSELQIFESVFFNHLQTGLVVGAGETHISCSHFAENAIGVLAGFGSWLNLAKFGGSIFSSNTTAIRLNQGFGVAMRGGNNSFLGNANTISGWLSTSNHFSFFDAFQNELSTPIQVWRMVNQQLQVVPVVNFDPLFTVQPSCARSLFNVMPQLKNANEEARNSNVIGSVSPFSNPVLYPNPAQETCCISLDGPIERVQVISQSGKSYPLSIYENGFKERCFDVQALSRGYYHVIITSSKDIVSLPLVVK